MRVLLSGLWICAVTIASCYAAVTFGGGFFSKSTEPYLEGLQYQKLAPINIPMVADGKVQGYVIAVLVFTADAKLMHTLPVAPNAFVVDEPSARSTATPRSISASSPATTSTAGSPRSAPG